MLAVALLITLIHAFNQIKFDYVSQRSTTDRLTGAASIRNRVR
jgi:hypothetical protein